MYVWSENVASRGSQEIGSCLVKHLNEHLPKETKNLLLYSDSCGGQNRNIKLALTLEKFLLLHDTLDSIEQNFFVPGHSFNSCDRSFAVIENAKKKANGIYTPDQWISLIECAKINEPKFMVTKMSSEDFLSTCELEQMITNRKIDEDKNKINWLHFRSIRYSKKEPLVLVANKMARINLKRKGIDEKSFGECAMPLLYPNGRCIDVRKYKDLLELIKYIPNEYHDFYKNLTTDDEQIDFGLADDSDEED